MKQLELIEQISRILETILSDEIVSPNEISVLQDWLEDNSVEFIGDDYNSLIIPLQKFIEDGQLLNCEIDNIKTILTKIKDSK